MKTTGPIAAKDAEETNAALRGATIHVRLIWINKPADLAVIKLKKLTIEVIIIHPFFSTSFALRRNLDF